MTTTRLFAPLLMATGLLAGCQLPSRNPLDPAVRPVAQLTIGNGPASYGSSPPGVIPVATCDVSDDASDSFSRARCLFLDATESDDPQGKGDIASFSYDLNFTGENDTSFHFRCSDEGVLLVLNSAFESTLATLASNGAAALSCANPELPHVSPDLLRAFPSGPRKVRVRVADGAGGYDDAVEELAVTNQAPVARIASAKFVPSYGQLWTMPLPYTGVLGSAVSVVFNAGPSSDADGDVLHHCWLVADEPVPECVASPQLSPFEEQRTVVVPPSSTPSVTGVVVYVSDGETVSKPERGAVFGQPGLPGWAFSREGESAALLDTRRRSYPSLTDQVGTALITSGSPNAWDDTPYDDDSPARAIFGRTPGNVVFSSLIGGSGADPTYSAVLPAGEEILTIEVDESPSTPLVWVVTAAAGSRALRVHLLTPDLTAPLPSRPFTLLDTWESPTDDVLPGEKELVAFDRDTGILWVGVRFGGSVQGLRPNGGLIDDTETPIALASDRMLTGLAVRRLGNGGGTELWALESHNVFLGGSGSPPRMQRRVPGQSTETAVDFDPDDFSALGGAIASGPGFVGGPQAGSQDSLWVNVLGFGLAYLRVTGTAAAPKLGLETLLPEVGEGFTYVVDPLSGMYLLLAGGSYELQRALPTGTLLIATSGSRIDHIQRSTDGRIWTSLPAASESIDAILTVGAGAGREGVLMEAPLPIGLADPVIDYSSGDLWTPTVLTPGAERLSPAGVVIDRFTAIRQGVGFAPVVPAPARIVASDPKSGALWMVTTTDELYFAVPTAPRLRDEPDTAFSGGAPVPLLGTQDLGEHRIAAMAVQPMDTGIGRLVAMTTCFDTCPDPFGYYLKRIDVGGNAGGPATPFFATSAPVLNPNRTPRIARDLSDGGVCAAWIDPSSPNILAVRRFDANLVASPLKLVPLPGTLQLDAVGAAPMQNCWVAFTQNGNQRVGVYRAGPDEILGMRAGAMLPAIETFSPVLDLEHLAGGDSEQIWAGADGLVRLALFPSGGTTVIDVFEVLDTVDTTSLVAP